MVINQKQRDAAKKRILEYVDENPYCDRLMPGMFEDINPGVFTPMLLELQETGCLCYDDKEITYVLTLKGEKLLEQYREQRKEADNG